MACPPVLPAWRSTTPATMTRVPAARGCCFYHAGVLLKHPSLCPGGVGTLISRLPCAGAGTRCLPTFLLVGFTKTGSTAFFQYMQQHPFVRMARGKETSYLGARSLRGRASALAPMRSCQCACPRLECMLLQSGTKHRFAAALDLYEACAYCERGEVRSPLKSSAGKWRMPTAGSCRTQIRRTPKHAQPTHTPLRSWPALAGPGEPGLRMARGLARGGARRGGAARRPRETGFSGTGADRAGDLALCVLPWPAFQRQPVAGALVPTRCWFAGTSGGVQRASRWTGRCCCTPSAGPHLALVLHLPRPARQSGTYRL